MLCIKLTFRSSVNDATAVELRKYDIGNGEDFKKDFRQYKSSIGSFFNTVDAGIMELVKVEEGLLTDFVTIKFNVI